MTHEPSSSNLGAAPDDGERMKEKRLVANSRLGMLALQLKSVKALDEPSLYVASAGSDRIVVATIPLAVGINALTGNMLDAPATERAAIFVNRWSRPDASQLDHESIQIAAYIMDLARTKLFVRRDLGTAERTDRYASFGSSVPGYVSLYDARSAFVSSGGEIIDGMIANELALAAASPSERTSPNLLMYQQETVGLAMNLDRREGIAVQLG